MPVGSRASLTGKPGTANGSGIRMVARNFSGGCSSAGRMRSACDSPVDCRAERGWLAEKLSILDVAQLVERGALATVQWTVARRVRRRQDADWRAHHGWLAEKLSVVDVAQLVERGALATVQWTVARRVRRRQDADWRAHHGWLAEKLSVVDVAQLVRVPDCDSGCRGFESHHPPHFCTMQGLRAV